jgi:hypothetical protein
LPASVFHRWYDDGMWRNWRRYHLEYVKQLLLTLDTIPPVILEKLTLIATNREPAVVGEQALHCFADVVSGNCDAAEFATAAQFFDCLIESVMDRFEGKLIGEDAPALMMRWLPATDPLHIAQDPECGYGPHLGALRG